MAKLKGKTALVTGGSRGIGAAIAERLAQEGADVAITYAKSPDSAEKVVAQARAHGVKAEALQADAADGTAVKRVVGEVLRHFGHLDILVNNAGVFFLARCSTAQTSSSSKWSTLMFGPSSWLHERPLR